MKKIFLTITVITLGVFSNLNAQVTIGNNTTPDANAILDLQSNGSKGLLLPRVALIATNNASPMSAHTAGMTVYNTALNGCVYQWATPTGFTCHQFLLIHQPMEQGLLKTYTLFTTISSKLLL